MFVSNLVLNRHEICFSAIDLNFSLNEYLCSDFNHVVCSSDIVVVMILQTPLIAIHPASNMIDLDEFFEF